jgi:hypothetical protein
MQAPRATMFFEGWYFDLSPEGEGGGGRGAACSPWIRACYLQCTLLEVIILGIQDKPTGGIASLRHTK